MKICRFKYNQSIQWGLLTQDQQLKEVIQIAEIQKIGFIQFATKNVFINALDVEFLPPLLPSKIIGVADNFPRVGRNQPFFFQKSNESLTVHRQSIRIPSGLNIWSEPELGVVIGRHGYCIEESQAHQFILGYLPANDITAHDDSEVNHHLLSFKSRQNFCPVGRYIETDFVMNNRNIQGYLSDQHIRSGNLSQMNWSVEKVISEISKIIPLNPFDLILMGCPPALTEKKFIQANESYTVSIDGLEELKNYFL